MITARMGPYLLACLFHLIFAPPNSPTTEMQFASSADGDAVAGATATVEIWCPPQHYIAYVFSQITHLLTSETLNHYNIAQFNG